MLGGLRPERLVRGGNLRGSHRGTHRPARHLHAYVLPNLKSGHGAADVDSHGKSDAEARQRRRADASADARAHGAPDPTANAQNEAVGEHSHMHPCASATGEPIPNLGSLQIPMITTEYTRRGMMFTGGDSGKAISLSKTNMLCWACCSL